MTGQVSTTEATTSRLIATWRLLSPKDLSQLAAASGVLAGSEALPRLRKHMRRAKFEHGKEGKIPRANAWRAYRLALGSDVLAVVVLKVSEAFNLSEIDVFEVAGERDARADGVIEAALAFCLCDGAKNGGSMALQFTSACHAEGVPPSVRRVAAAHGVKLAHAGRGAVSPAEAEGLFLALQRLSPDSLTSINTLVTNRHASRARIAYLIATGTWPTLEAEMVLVSSPYPELILGTPPPAEARHLHAHALAHGVAACLSGTFQRALCLRARTDPEYQDSPLGGTLADVPAQVVGDLLAVIHGPFPAALDAVGWAGDPRREVTVQRRERLIALARPRGPEEIGVYFAQDLEEAAHAKRAARVERAAILYPADFRELPPDEREHALRAAQARGVEIFVCPNSRSLLEDEVIYRFGAGDRVRR